MEWGRRGDTFVRATMRTQLVAARTVAEALAELALAPDAPTYSEIAGPREESLPDMARLLAGGMRIVEVSDPATATPTRVERCSPARTRRSRARRSSSGSRSGDRASRHDVRRATRAHARSPGAHGAQAPVRSGR